MSKTKIWCLWKIILSWNKNFDVAQKVLWFRQRRVDVARKCISCQQKKSWCSTRKYFISTKTRWCCIKKIFCAKKSFFFFQNGAPYLTVSYKLSSWKIRKYCDNKFINPKEGYVNWHVTTKVFLKRPIFGFFWIG